MNYETKYCQFLGGFLAYVNGHTLRARDNRIKVFQTELEAAKAAIRSMKAAIRRS